MCERGGKEVEVQVFICSGKGGSLLLKFGTMVKLSSLPSPITHQLMVEG